MDYFELIGHKAYDFEMTSIEKDFCIEWETAHLKPLIQELRHRHRTDAYIAACLEDMYNTGLICDSVAVADGAGISDEDWDRGMEYDFKRNELAAMYEKAISAR